jgi:acyl-CoA thioesterase-1
VVNASISGDTTIGGRNRLPALLTQHKPEVLVIELGANDALRGLPLKTSQDNLQAMIDLAPAEGQGAAGGHADSAQLRPRLHAPLRRDVPDLAKNKVALVPFFFEGIAADLSLFQADRIHPNEQAQPRLLDNVWPHLKPLLGMK